MARIDREVGGYIICVRIDELDLIPELVLCFFRRSDRANEELVVLHVQVVKLNLVLIGGREHGLILLLELIEALLRALLLLSIRCTASKHLVKKSHDEFPFTSGD